MSQRKTITIPDALHDELQEWTEINCSQICTTALQEEVERRKRLYAHRADTDAMVRRLKAEVRLKEDETHRVYFERGFEWAQLRARLADLQEIERLDGSGRLPSAVSLWCAAHSDWLDDAYDRDLAIKAFCEGAAAAWWEVRDQILESAPEPEDVEVC